MTEESLTAEILRLQKQDLDPAVQRSLEEAAQLLAEGRLLEAQALVENADARARRASGMAASAGD